MALKVLSLTDTLPAEAIVVGDTTFDIEMGRAAGCMTCGVTYGNHNRDILKSSRADFLIDNFSQYISARFHEIKIFQHFNSDRNIVLHLI